MATVENNNNPLIQVLLSKRWAIVRHLLLWSIVAAMFNLHNPASLMAETQKTGVDFTAFYVVQVFMAIFAICLIYVNYYFLYPRFFLRGKFITYFIGLFILSSTLFLMSYFSQQIFVIYYGKNGFYAMKFSLPDFISLSVTSCVVLMQTTAYRVFKSSIADRERFAVLEKEKLKTELSQLKNQVNPHFLFNTLNNLSVLINANPQKASEMVLGISDVLRYQIYDSQHDQVFLKKDMEILQEYLALEKMRRDDLTIQVNVKSNISNVVVPPLLFVNFVDNAIKHSQSREPSFINIDLSIVDKTLCFDISNSKPASISPYMAIAEKGSLGLANVKKRLDLLYGTAHHLEIIDEQKLFTIKLKIPV